MSKKQLNGKSVLFDMDLVNAAAAELREARLDVDKAAAAKRLAERLERAANDRLAYAEGVWRKLPKGFLDNDVNWLRSNADSLRNRANEVSGFPFNGRPSPSERKALLRASDSQDAIASRIEALLSKGL